MDCGEVLLNQLTYHWEHRARPRLEGLTDEELHWEPVPGCWGIRPRAEATSAIAAGSGDLVIDFDWPDPEPAPVTTIAWRLGHVTVSVFGGRNASHFGGPPMDYFSVDWPGDAASTVALLDEGYDRWVAGVGGLDEAGLDAPCGPAEQAWADEPLARLVTHVHREVIHHLAEVALLRDLYRHRTG